jgi:hypothetical protein
MPSAATWPKLDSSRLPHGLYHDPFPRNGYALRRIVPGSRDARTAKNFVPNASEAIVTAA